MKKKGSITILILLIIIILTTLGYYYNYYNSNNIDDFIVVDENDNRNDKDNNLQNESNNDKKHDNDNLIYSGLQLNILIDTEELRTYTWINFSVDNTPDNSNVTWEMGDGTILYGQHIRHLYRSSNYFQINVTSIWGNEFAFESLEIPIKNIDGKIWGEIRTYLLGIAGVKAMSVALEAQPGITIPYQSFGYINVTNVVNDLEIGIRVYKKNSDNHKEEIDTVIHEVIEKGRVSKNITWSISKEKLEKYEIYRPYYIGVFYQWLNYSGLLEFSYNINIEF